MFNRRLNIILLTSFLLLTGLAAYYSSQLTFNFSLEIFFPHNDPDAGFYQEFKNRFEPDDNYLFVALEHDRPVFEHGFLQKALEFTWAADSLPFVKDASSLVTMKKPLYVMDQLRAVPILTADNQDFQRDSALIMEDPRLVNRFISGDARALNVVIVTEDTLSLSQSQVLHAALLDLVGETDAFDIHISGRPHYQVLLADKSQDEFRVYAIFITLVIGIIIGLIYRRVITVVVAVLSIWTGMLFFTGFLQVIGEILNPLSAVFPVLLMIVGISDVIHITTKYVDEYRRIGNKKTALRKAVREVGMATFLTSTTTAIGFSALAVTKVPAIREFGIFAAAGVFIMYFVVMFFTTTVLAMFRVNSIAKPVYKKNHWNYFLQWVYIVTWKRKNLIGAIGGLAIITCLVGISRISTDTHFVNHFPRQEKVHADYMFIENNFGGVRSLELSVTSKTDTPLTTYHNIKQIDSLEQVIASFKALSSVYTPATIYKSLHRAYRGDRPQFYKVGTEARFDQLDRDKEIIPRQTLNILLDSTERHGRITARFKDVGSDSSRVIHDSLTRWINKNLDTASLEFRHTGTYFLFDKNDRLGRISLFQGLGLAFLVISFLMALLFRNWKMVIISLFPNIIPMLIGGALLGFFQIEMSVSTAVIFAIAFGIAVDDTIHFLTKFKLERSKGFKIDQALRNTLLETGKALILTTLILFFGFLLLLTSTYPTTFYLGMLLSITLLFALIADLFLLPVFIYWFLGKD